MWPGWYLGLPSTTLHEPPGNTGLNQTLFWYDLPVLHRLPIAQKSPQAWFWNAAPDCPDDSPVYTAGRAVAMGPGPGCVPWACSSSPARGRKQQCAEV